MEYVEIMHKINSGLTGDWEKDVEYLENLFEEYAQHHYRFEIFRAIGRLLFRVLPETEQKKFNYLFQKEQYFQETIFSEVKRKIAEGDINSAEKLICSVLPPDGGYEEDAVSIYMSFRNHLEHYYFLDVFEPKKEVIIAPFPYNDFYELCAYIFVEKKEYQKALSIIEEALKRNPLNTFLMFERTEIYKNLNDNKTFKWLTVDICKYLYKRRDLSRYFRGLGWYFVDEKLWKPAIAAYTISLHWDRTEMAESQLYYISKQTGQLPDNDEINACYETLKKEEVDLWPDPKWMQIAWWLAENAMEVKNFDLAAKYYEIFADFTGDKDAEQKRQECMRGH